MTRSKTRRADIKLYQVHHQAWMPPVLVAARTSETAAEIAVHGLQQSSPFAVIMMEVTDDFRALSATFKAQTDALIAGGVEGSVTYDEELGWTYDALSK